MNQGVIGTCLPAQQIDAYDEGDEYFGGQKIYSAFREWIPEIPAVNYGEYTAQTRDVISAVAPEYLNGSLSIEDVFSANRQPDSRSDAVTTVVCSRNMLRRFA